MKNDGLEYWEPEGTKVSNMDQLRGTQEFSEVGEAGWDPISDFRKILA